MRATNRGDVPRPHVAPGQAKNAADPGEDVVFDAGSLSFVKDWVVDGGDGGGGGAAAADVEPTREDPRQSNPNRWLGVGAQPKKPKQERPEPSALEKKLLRKRQRQELSDAVAGEVDTHGVVGDDKDGDGESKTASFKKKTKKRQGREEQEATPLAPPASAAGKKKSKKSKKDKDKKDKQDGADPAAVEGGGDETTAGEEGGEGEGKGEDEGEKQGRKRKARRKKNKSIPTVTDVVAEGVDSEADAAAAVATPQTSDAVLEQQQQPSVVAEAELDEPGETKKQRRGWGKARPKPAASPAPAPAPAERPDQTTGDAEEGGWREDERRPRKKTKTRSRQKNIRKDKRPLEKRPSYLRAGDPEFSGRGLTGETRKFLGLPADDDLGEAPPAGWGKPGKAPAKPGFLIDKKPRRLPEHLAPEAGGGGGGGGGGGSGGDGDGVEAAEAEVSAAIADGSRPSSSEKPRSKSKYKNLTLPTGTGASKTKASAKNNKDKKEGQAK